MVRKNKKNKFLKNLTLNAYHLPLICTDSRQIKKGQVFLPLVGEKFDGHGFINDVCKKGIISFSQRNKISKVRKEYRKNLILVEDTLDTYHKIANQYRKRINPIVIAITGSSGKTTTKDLIASLLSTKYQVHKTKANFNNQFGVPKTILEMPTNTEVLVLELAMRQKGEIKYLSRTAEPDIAVITNIGKAHIGRLGNIETIIKAKCEILEHLKKDGLLVLFKDKKLMSVARKKWNGKIKSFDLNQVSKISFKGGKTYFKLNKENYYINALGKTHILNSACAILIAQHFKLSKSRIQKGLANFKIPPGRGDIIKLKKDIFIINETYNANPDSVKAAVSNLVDCWGKDYKKILVLGKLAELGRHENKLLKELFLWLKHKPIYKIIHAKNINECYSVLRKLLKPKTIILIKGSHVAGLGKLVKIIEKNAKIKN